MRHYARLLIATGLLLAPLQALAQNGIVELPQQFIDTTYPAQSGELTVCASGCTHTNLQTAINAAVPGNTIKVAAGWVHTGTITLPSKTNPNNLWIVIRSASTAFDPGGSLAPGTRVGPANTASMAVIESPGGNGVRSSPRRTPADTGSSASKCGRIRAKRRSRS